MVSFLEATDDVTVASKLVQKNCLLIETKRVFLLLFFWYEASLAILEFGD